MDTFEILRYVLIFALGGVIGYKLSQAYMLMSFRQILDELGITDRQMQQLAEDNGVEVADSGETPGLTPVEIFIEQHHGQLFAYRLADGVFLGQAADGPALVQRLTENLSNVRVIVDKDHGADYLTDH